MHKNYSIVNWPSKHDKIIGVLPGSSSRPQFIVEKNALKPKEPSRLSYYRKKK